MTSGQPLVQRQPRMGQILLLRQLVRRRACQQCHLWLPVSRVTHHNCGGDGADELQWHGQRPQHPLHAGWMLRRRARSDGSTRRGGRHAAVVHPVLGHDRCRRVGGRATSVLGGGAAVVAADDRRRGGLLAAAARLLRTGVPGRRLMEVPVVLLPHAAHQDPLLHQRRPV